MEPRRLWLSLIITLVVLMRYDPVMGESAEASLLTELLSKYPTEYGMVRPVENNSQAVNVSILFMFLQILDFDQQKQVMTIRGWTRLDWHDAFLKWSPGEHGGVDRLAIDKDKIWTPDITLFNAVSAPKLIVGSKMAVSHTGAVTYVPAHIYEFACPTNPEQNNPSCALKFGSWTLHSGLLNLTSASNRINADFYTPHQDWELGITSAAPHVETYVFGEKQYGDVTFSFKLKRRQPLEDEDEEDKSSASVTLPLLSTLLACFLSQLLKH